MKLSIITVNLNNRAGLQKTIDSVVCQTFDGYEWIVVDGGSDDGSCALIESHAARFAWWVSEPDKGIYNAMNKGIAHASGDYLLFLNSGDELAGATVLDRVFKKNYNDDILYGDCTFLKDGKKLMTRKKEDKMTLYSLVYTGIFHQSAFIRRTLLAETPYNESYRILADLEFNIRQYVAGRSFRHLPFVVSRFDTGGISSTRLDIFNHEKQRLLHETLPAYVVDELRSFDDFVDGQLCEAKRLRDKGIVYKKMLSLNIVCMRLLEKIQSCFSTR